MNESQPAPAPTPPVDNPPELRGAALELSQLARLYSDGQMTWPEIRDDHSIDFGSLLVELGRQGVKMPMQRDNPRLIEARAKFVEALGVMR